MRGLAVTTTAHGNLSRICRRWAKFFPGYEASAWFGMVGPKNMPAGVVEKLNREINAALADPRIRARLADAGGTVLPGSPADFGKLIADETEKWAKVIKFAGIKPS